MRYLKIITILGLLLSLLLSSNVHALESTSTSFEIHGGAIESISGRATSTTYKETGAGGQLATGLSTNVKKIYSGILYWLYLIFKPDYRQIHYRWRNDDGTEVTASWAANEDTQLDNLTKNTIRRLRFEISNEGWTRGSGQTFKIEYSQTSGCATGTYTALPVTPTTEHWQIADSTNLTDGNPTTNVSGGLTDENAVFVAGQVKDTGNQTSAITLTSQNFTEIEFSIKATDNAVAGIYCFRLTNAGSIINFTYSVYPKVLVSGVAPNATSFTNSSESGLNNLGARISQTIVASGTDFGTVSPGSRANCAGGSGTGCVKIGTSTVPDASVTAWSSTTITFIASSSITVYGGTGTNGLVIYAAGVVDSSPLTFYVYPDITSVTAPEIDAAREYAAGDTDGLIMLSGNHLGTGGTTTILGATSTVHATAEGACSVGGHTDTSICLEVPESIADNVYTGSIVLTRGIPADNRTDTYSGFRILPRIIDFTPSSAPVGDPVTVNGNHFCQNAAVCPSAFDTNNKVVFYNNKQAPVFTSWSNTAMSTQVPSGAITGEVVLTSNGYDSNGKSFTVPSTVPNDPTLTEPPNRQFKSDDSTVINLGSSTIESTVILKADISASISINMRLQIEVQPVGTGFTCTGTYAIGSGGCTAYSGGAGALEGTVGGGGGCNGCISLSQAKITFSSLADGNKHWQARVRNASTSEYSAWVSYGGNPESSTDFRIDTTPPTISNVSYTNVGSNSASTTWDTLDEQSTSRVQYNKTGSFGYCPTDCTALYTNMVFNHVVSLTGLDSGTTYYYRVFSQDAAGNEATSTVYNFATQSVTQPAKTTSFHIMGATGTISGGTVSTTSFSVVMPETSAVLKSAFVEVKGVYDTTGSSPNGIAVKVNSQTTKTYALPAVSAKNHFEIVYEVTSVNIDPSTNTFTITPETNTTIYISSVDIKVTYAYTP